MQPSSWRARTARTHVRRTQAAEVSTHTFGAARPFLVSAAGPFFSCCCCRVASPHHPGRVPCSRSALHGHVAVSVSVAPCVAASILMFLLCGHFCWPPLLCRMCIPLLPLALLLHRIALVVRRVRAPRAYVAVLAAVAPCVAASTFMFLLCEHFCWLTLLRLMCIPLLPLALCFGPCSVPYAPCGSSAFRCRLCRYHPSTARLPLLSCHVLLSMVPGHALLLILRPCPVLVPLCLSSCYSSVECAFCLYWVCGCVIIRAPRATRQPVIRLRAPRTRYASITARWISATPAYSLFQLAMKCSAKVRCLSVHIGLGHWRSDNIDFECFLLLLLSGLCCCWFT